MNLLTLVDHTLLRAAMHNRAFTIYRLNADTRATNQETFIVRLMSEPAPDPQVAQVVMTIYPVPRFDPNEDTNVILQGLD